MNVRTFALDSIARVAALPANTCLLVDLGDTIGADLEHLRVVVRVRNVLLVREEMLNV